MAAVLALDSMSLQSWPEPLVDIQPLMRPNPDQNKSKRCSRNESSSDGNATQAQLLQLFRHAVQQHQRSPAVAVRTVVGRRPYQEDAYAIATDLLGAATAPCSGTAAPSEPRYGHTQQSENSGSLPVLHYAAVFDGHGGSAVSQHCTESLVLSLRSWLLRTLRKPCGLLQSDSSTDSLTDEQLFGNLQQQLSEGNSLADSQSPGAVQQSCGSPEAVAAGLAVAGLSNDDAKDCLFRSFADCDASIPEAASAEGGSTAVCALIGSDNIWVANCGDSRAVIARRGSVMVPLTEDHKPERPDEAARVKAAGGHVFWNGGHRVMGVLSMSRAMGDHYLKQYGVISTPEITCTQRTPEDEFLLLASDGLWMSLSNEDAVSVASACVERAQARGADRQAALRVAAQVLVKAALQQGSSDNITVVLMDLQGSSPGAVPPAQAVATDATGFASPTAQPAPHCSGPMEADDIQPQQQVSAAPSVELPGQLQLSPIQPMQCGMHSPVLPEPLTSTAGAATPARSGSKRMCVEGEELEGEQRSREVAPASPIKRTRLSQQGLSFSGPLLDLSTERLLVSVPSPCISPRDT